MKQKYLECAKIINKRGISGEVKAECYCDSPSALKNVKTLYTSPDGNGAHEVVSLKEYKGFLYIKFSDITDASLADSMRMTILYAKREDIAIDDGRSFIADLLGQEVCDVDSGKVYGKIKDVQNFGASDIYVISDGENEYLLPAVDGIVISKDESKVYVRPIDGIFTTAEEIK